jgi:hypothetical protein
VILELAKGCQRLPRVDELQLGLPKATRADELQLGLPKATRSLNTVESKEIEMYSSQLC